jgi:hypothetical protein
MVTFKEHAILFGGIEGITHEKNDLFLLNLETLIWTEVEGKLSAEVL